MRCLILAVSLHFLERNIRNDGSGGRERERETSYEAACWYIAQERRGVNVIQSQIGRRHDAAVHLKSLDSLFIYRFAYLFVVKGDDRFLPRIILNNCLRKLEKNSIVPTYDLAVDLLGYPRV